MKSMNGTRSWAEYRRILAEDFGITLDAEPREQRIELRGHALRVDRWQPAGEARGTLILVHGGGGNGRVLAPFAELAVACGWQALAPDLPGYGLTEPAPCFDWDYAEWPAVIAGLAERAAAPVVLMGLSMGGMTAVAAAQGSERVRAVIATTLLELSQPALFDRAARWPWLGTVTRLAMALAPGLLDRLRLPLALAAPLAAMSSSPRLQRYFRRDPLLGASWKPVRFFRTAHRYRLASNALPCPLLLVHPGTDRWTPTRLSLPVFERLETDKRFIELSNGAHLPLEEPAYRELAAALGRCLLDVETAALERPPVLRESAALTGAPD